MGQSRIRRGIQARADIRDHNSIHSLMRFKVPFCESERFALLGGTGRACEMGNIEDILLEEEGELE